VRLFLFSFTILSSSLPFMHKTYKARHICIAYKHSKKLCGGKKMKKMMIMLMALLVLATPMVLADWDDDDRRRWRSQSKDIDSIVDVAVAVNSDGPFAGSFDTLIAALQETPIILRVLDSPRARLTVFAPTDDAFAAIGYDEDNIDTIPRRDLANILLYHVTRGTRDAESVLDSDRIRMLNRRSVDQDGGVLTDNQGGESTIIVTDVKADNGIIHVIDNVLLP
jgi:uncharacterized surface protein with fasciclin (FAS1) repeats